MTDENNIQATVFMPQGSTLELRRVARVKANGDEVFGFGGFDTTGRRLNLRLPEGYTPAENPYVLFQWLDDDRFAVMPGARTSTVMASRVTETSSSATSPERNAPWPSPGPLACLPATNGRRLPARSTSRPAELIQAPATVVPPPDECTAEGAHR